MTLLWTEFSPEGAVVIDDEVHCTDAIDIGGTTYYRGYMSQLAEDSVIGDTSDDYGAWTAVAQGGDRLTVVVGLPGDTSEAGVDLVSGRVLLLTSDTVFLRYIGHGEFVRSPIPHMDLPTFGLLDDGTVQDIASRKAHRALEIVGYQVIAPLIGGIAPIDDVSLQLRDALAGGGDVHSETVDCGTGVEDTGAVTFDAPFIVDADDAITLRGDGQGAQMLQFILFYRPR